MNPAQIKIFVALLMLHQENSLKEVVTTRELVDLLVNATGNSDQWVRGIVSQFANNPHNKFLVRISQGKYKVDPSLFMIDKPDVVYEPGIVKMIGDMAKPEYGTLLLGIAASMLDDNMVPGSIVVNYMGTYTIKKLIENDIIRPSSKGRYMVNPDFVYVGYMSQLKKIQTLWQML